MKKTLVALAALAAASAFAQSSVTLSGNVDLGMQQTKENGYSSLANNAVETTRKQSGPIGNGATGWTSSALGLDIKEDIGSGTTAGYSAAMNIQSWGAGNDSANQALFTGRHSYAYFGSQAAGEVRLGYQYTLDDQIQGGVGRATPTGNIAGRVQNYALNTLPIAAAPTAPAVNRESGEVVTSGAVTRANGIQYASPTWKGLQGLVQYMSQADDKDQAAVATSGKADGNMKAVALKYNNGPLNVGGAYSKFVSDANTAGDATKNLKTTAKLVDLAANYDFGVAKVFGNYYTRTTDIAAGTAYNGALTSNVYGLFKDGGRVKRTGYDLGVSAPFGKTTVYASVGKGKYKTIDGAGIAEESANVKGYTLAAAYNFSKRTAFNVYTGSVKATNDVTELKKTQYGFGLNHSF